MGSRSFERSSVGNPTTLILQMNSSQIRLNLVQSNKLIGLNSWRGMTKSGEIFTVSPYVLLSVGRNFLFGKSAKELYNRAKSSYGVEGKYWEHLRFWNLGELINEQETFTKPETLTFNGSKCNYVNLELLLACFVNYVVLLVQNTKWDGVSDHTPLEIRQLLFCVPIHFSSVARQRLKDAGGILGLETRVVSEVIPAIYLYHLEHLETKNGHQYQPANSFVLSENSGNVDAAFFTTAFPKTQLVTKRGEEEDKPPVRKRWLTFDPEYLKKKFEKSENEMEIRSRVCMVIWEFRNELPPVLIDCFHNYPKNLFIFCTDPKWTEIMEEESFVQLSSSLDPIPEIAMNWDNSWEPFSLEKMYGEGVEDLTPHKLYWSEKVEAGWIPQRFAEPSGTLMKATFSYPLSRVVIHEGKNVDERFIIGILNIPLINYFRYSEIEVHLRWNKQEGIYRFDRVYGCSCDEEFKKLLKVSEDYYWQTGSLSGGDKLRLSKVAKDIEDYGMKFQEQWKRLLSKCEDLRKKIKSAESKKQKMFEKNVRNSKHPEKAIQEDSELEEIRQILSKVLRIQDALRGAQMLSLDFEETESELDEIAKCVT